MARAALVLASKVQPNVAINEAQTDAINRKNVNAEDASQKAIMIASLAS